MSSNSSSKSKRTPVSLRAALAPGHFFFCRRVALPPDVGGAEARETVKLEIESLSPFPLEHMQYGYRVDSQRRFAFVFAAYKRRFADGEIAGWERNEFVFPDFAIALGAPRQSKAPLLLRSETSVTYLEFDQASELPSRSFSMPLARDEEGVALPLEKQLQALGATARLPLEESSLEVWEVEPKVFTDGDDARLQARLRGTEEKIVWRSRRGALWSMDIRDEPIVERTKVEERRNAILWKAALGMAAAVALLLAGEVAYFLSLGYKEARERWNEEQQPRVDQIEAKRNTVNELLQFQESNLVPFEMLTAIDRFRYANGRVEVGKHEVTYEKIETNGPNGLLIDAYTSQASQATDFKNRLSGFPKVDSVNLENIKSDSKKGTSFRAVVRFRNDAFIDSAVGEVASRG